MSLFKQFFFTQFLSTTWLLKFTELNPLTLDSCPQRGNCVNLRVDCVAHSVECEVQGLEPT